MFPEWVVFRGRLLYQNIQYDTSQTAFIQCTKQSLFYNVGAASHVNQSSSMRQTIEPRRIEYPVCFGSQWQHVHKDVALP
ncbi:hypothetical protein D3C73_1521430 [compost metagenome]